MRIRTVLRCLASGHDWMYYGYDWPDRRIVKKDCRRCEMNLTDAVEHK